MAEEKIQKPWYKKIWVWVLIFIGIIFVLSAFSEPNAPAQNGQDTTPPASTNEQTTQENPTPAEEVKEPTWQEVKTWSGSGRKTTEPFTITGEQWRVNWNNKSGYLGVTVRQPGREFAEAMPVNTTSVTSDTSYVYKNGQFYLDINSTGSWAITIEELK